MENKTNLQERSLIAIGRLNCRIVAVSVLSRISVLIAVSVLNRIGWRRVLIAVTWTRSLVVRRIIAALFVFAWLKFEKLEVKDKNLHCCPF
jgi:hypothetical protein